MTALIQSDPLLCVTVYDRLYSLRDAYINLEVLLAPNNADSGNVTPVIAVINLEFDRLIADLDSLRS